MRDLCDKDKPVRPPRKKRPKRARKVEHRERRRDEVLDYDWVMNHLQAFPSPCPYPMHTKRTVGVNQIIDRAGYLEEWVNPCYHLEYSEFGGVMPPSNPRSELDLSIVADSAPLPDFFTCLDTNIPRTIPGPVLDECRDAALEHFVEAFKPEALLLGSLLEALNIVKLLKDMAETGLAKQMKAKRDYQRVYRWYLSKGYTEIAASYIAAQFVILPFVRDIQVVWCSFQKVRKRLDWIIKHNGKAVRVRYARPNVMQIDPAEHIYVAGGPGSYIYGHWNTSCPPWVNACAQPEREQIAGRYILINKVYKLDFHAQAMVVYRMPYELFGQVTQERTGDAAMAYASVWGLDKIGSSIWEAIPFSWLVDWFTDMVKRFTSFIDDETRLWPPGEILPGTVGHSFKLTSEWEAHYDIEDDPNFGQNLGPVQYNVYVRGYGLPMSGAPYTLDPVGFAHYNRPYISTAFGVLVFQKDPFDYRRKRYRRRRRVR